MINNYPRMKTLSLVFFIEVELKRKSGGKHPSIGNICRDVACDVMKTNSKALIPPLLDTRVVTLLQKYYDEYKKLTKFYNNRIKVQSFKYKLNAFLEQSKKLFDFAHCKHE